MVKVDVGIDELFDRQTPKPKRRMCPLCGNWRAVGTGSCEWCGRFK